MLHGPKGRFRGHKRKPECSLLKKQTFTNTKDSNAYEMHRSQVTDTKHKLKNHINTPTTYNVATPNLT
jgi:hypothetical protein